MFQVIYPWFSEFETLISIYTNIPYIIAIFVLSRLYGRLNKVYALFVGIAFWGITFLLFASMDKSPLSFVVICSFMLAACGIFDFFWWSIMANLLEYHKRPTIVFGICLSMNVLGVGVGGLIGNKMIVSGATKENLALFGLSVVIIAMIIIVPLSKKLALLLVEYQFFFALPRMDIEDKDRTKEIAVDILTKREYEVFENLW